MKYLFLDDIRNPSDVTWIDIGRDVPWNVVRSYNEAVNWVLENGFPNTITFDHDLGYEEWETDGTTGIVVVTCATEEKSGLDFAKFLIEHDLDNSSMPADFTFTVHSMNPTGTRNIQLLLDNYIRHKRNYLLTDK
jgi:hypothetical protein